MTNIEPRPVGETAGQRVTSDGTGWLLAGSIIGGLAAYGFQVVGTRALGDEAFAPVAALWTIQYLVWSVVFLAIETLVVRETLRALDGTALHRTTAIGTWRWIVGTAIAVTAACWLVRDRLFFGLGELALVAGAIVLSFGALTVVRGRLAGRGRYRAYGAVSAGESVVRLAAAGTISLAGATTRTLAWTLPIGAAAAAASWIVLRRRTVRGGRHRQATMVAAPSDPVSVGRFLVPATVANGATQLLLAGGPVALVALSASPAELSVFFVTLTAARVPVVVALGGLLSRLLPVFAEILARRGHSAIPRVASIVAAAAVVVAVLGAGLAGAVGGPLVGTLFGAGLEPPGWLAAAATAGVVLATGGMVINQLLIAGGLERWLAPPWLAGLISAIVATAIMSGTPSWRVGVSFVVGTVISVATLVGVARLAVRRRATSS